MKFGKSSCCVLMFMVIGLGIAPPCSAKTAGDKTSMEEVKQEAEDLVQALKAYTIEQRDEAVQKSQEALDHLDKRIDALETTIDRNWDKMDTAAREKARASQKALRKQRTEVAERYGRLKGSSAEAWGHLKKGFSDAYKELHNAWEKSEQEFGADK